LTKDTLRRPWCAGEIAVTHLTHQRCTVVYTIALARPATREIEASGIRLYLANLDVSLPENGVTDQFIADAFLWLLDVLSSGLRLSGEIGGRGKFRLLVDEVLRAKRTHDVHSCSKLKP